MKRRLFLWSLLLPLFCTLFGLGARAANCTTNLPTTLPFGNIDILPGGGMIGQSSFNISCSGISNGETVRVCAAFAGSNINLGNSALRSMTQSGSSQTLNYSLFVYGSAPNVFTDPSNSFVYVNLGGASSATATIYLKGAVADGQSARSLGSYSETIAITFFSTSYAGSAAPTDCSFPRTNQTSASVTVGATIIPNCSVTAGNLIFPPQSIFSADVSGGSTLTVACTSNAPYWVSLDAGENALNGQRRMKSSNNNYISYDLYRDGGSSLRWGQTKDVDTVSGAGTSTGQSLPVYGRIPKPTIQPAPGLYSDRVTATVHF
jgi:spore coat protein U-like protein